MIPVISQPLSDARSFGHEKICKILEANGGIDPVFPFVSCTRTLNGNRLLVMSRNSVDHPCNFAFQKDTASQSFSV